MSDDPAILVFDNEGECTPESLERLLSGNGFGGRRDRPYSGQPWTAHGTRGETLVVGLTMRDIGDCIARGAHLARGPETDPGIDTTAVIQSVLIEIEKAMGIYPNVPDGPIRIPMLTIGPVTESPDDAS